MVQEDVVIRLVLTGDGRVTKAFQRVGKSAKKADTSSRFLQRTLIALGGTAVLRSIVRTADTYTRLQNALRVVTNGSEELAAVTEKLFGVSRRTRTSFAANADLFRRLQLSTRELAVSTNDLLIVTEAVNQAIIISGASTQEASAGLIQLAQGLAAGALRGDELRSVLEQLPFVAQVIQKELGVTRGELRDLGAEGKITAEVITAAFLTQADEIQALFEKIQPTLAQSVQVLKDSLLRLIGELDKAGSVTSFFGDFLRETVAPNIEVLAKAIGVLSVALGVGYAAKAVPAAITATKALTAAILKNPIGLLAALLVSGVAALVLFGDKMRVAGEESATVRDFMVELLKLVRDVGLVFVSAAVDLAKSLGVLETDATTSFKSIVEAAAKMADGTVGFFVGLGSALALAIQRWTWPTIVEDIFFGLLAVAQSFGTSLVAIFEGFGRGVGGFASAAGALSTGNFEDAKSIALATADSISLTAREVFGDWDDAIIRNFNDLKSNSSIQTTVEDTGQTIGQQFLTGLQSVTGSLDIVNRLFKRADEGKAGREESDTAQADLDTRNKATAADEKRLSTIAELNVALEERLRLAGLNTRERVIATELAKIEQKFLKEGLDLSLQENQALLDKTESRLRDIQVQEEATRIVEEAAGGLEEFNFQIQALVEASDKLSEAQLADQFRDIRIAFLDTQSDFASGFERGILKLGADFGDFADIAEKSITGAFNSAATALSDFARTGSLDFRAFISSVLADLARLAAQKLLLDLLGKLAGSFAVTDTAQEGIQAGAETAGAGSGSVGVPSFNQAGGPVAAGAQQIVGEQGPELFTPTAQGNITSASGTAAAVAPPVVNINVVNVTDPNELTAALATPEGDKTIINAVRRNRRAIQQELQ